MGKARMCGSGCRCHASSDSAADGRAGDCPNCGMWLDRHQPDVEMPDRLLGTCGGCKAWYLIGGMGVLPLQLLPGKGPAEVR